MRAESFYCDDWDRSHKGSDRGEHHDQSQYRNDDCGNQNVDDGADVLLLPRNIAVIYAVVHGRASLGRAPT